MVEPEVIMDGDHTIEVSYEVHEAVLRSLFNALYEQNVMLEGTILKVSMVIPVKDCEEQAEAGEEIGRAQVCTPVPNAQVVCRLLLETKKNIYVHLHITPITYHP